MHGYSRRIEALEELIDPARSDLTLVMCEPNETNEEALARTLAMGGSSHPAPVIIYLRLSEPMLKSGSVCSV